MLHTSPFQLYQTFFPSFPTKSKYICRLFKYRRDCASILTEKTDELGIKMSEIVQNKKTISDVVSVKTQCGRSDSILEDIIVLPHCLSPVREDFGDQMETTEHETVRILYLFRTFIWLMIIR